MERKILVEVTKEELKALEKGIPTKENVLKGMTDDDLFNEIIKRAEYSSRIQYDEILKERYILKKLETSYGHAEIRLSEPLGGK